MTHYNVYQAGKLYYNRVPERTVIAIAERMILSHHRKHSMSLKEAIPMLMRVGYVVAIST